MSRYIPIWVADVAVGGPRGSLARQALLSSVGNFLAPAITAPYLIGPAGLTARMAAFTMAMSAVLTLVASPPAARLIRMLGPRRFAFVSSLVRAALLILLVLGIAPMWTVFLFLLIGLSEAAAFSVYQLIISSTLGDDARTEALSVRRTLGNIGFTVGGLLTAVVLGAGTSLAYAAGFGLSAVCIALSALFLVRLPASSDEIVTPDEAVGKASAWRDPRFAALVLLAVVMATSFSLLTVGVPLWVIQETTVPNSVVGVLLVINTILVVALQVRVSRRAEDWPGAARSVVTGALLFAGAIVLIALSGHVEAWIALVCLVASAVVAAVAEMLDSAAWWTISFEYAHPAHRPDYLATFDAVVPAVTIIGPPLMFAIVGLGTVGWLTYAGVFVVTALVAHLLLHGHQPGSTGDAPQGGVSAGDTPQEGVLPQAAG